jgi:hypothetical protein
MTTQNIAVIVQKPYRFKKLAIYLKAYLIKLSEWVALIGVSL